MRLSKRSAALHAVAGAAAAALAITSRGSSGSASTGASRPCAQAAAEALGLA